MHPQGRSQKTLPSSAISPISTVLPTLATIPVSVATVSASTRRLAETVPIPMPPTRMTWLLELSGQIRVILSGPRLLCSLLAQTIRGFESQHLKFVEFAGPAEVVSLNNPRVVHPCGSSDTELHEYVSTILVLICASRDDLLTLLCSPAVTTLLATGASNKSAIVLIWPGGNQAKGYSLYPVTPPPHAPPSDCPDGNEIESHLHGRLFLEFSLETSEADFQAGFQALMATDGFTCGVINRSIDTTIDRAVESPVNKDAGTTEGAQRSGIGESRFSQAPSLLAPQSNRKRGETTALSYPSRWESVPLSPSRPRLQENRGNRKQEPSKRANPVNPITSMNSIGHLRQEYQHLTSREEQVARLAAQGSSNADIAEMLGATQSTIKSHLQSTFKKTGILRRSQLAALFVTLFSLITLMTVICFLIC